MMEAWLPKHVVKTNNKNNKEQLQKDCVLFKVLYWLSYSGSWNDLKCNYNKPL
jgi:hypothetical protein